MKDIELKNLVIGGAQLGLRYGINNSHGRLNDVETHSLLSVADSNGIEYIDTARDYGESEKKIGDTLRKLPKSSLKVITKFNIGKYVTSEASVAEINKIVDRQLGCSLKALDLPKLDVALLHRVRDITAFGNAVLNKLTSLKEEGTIRCLGASVQSPEEMLFALNYLDIEFIQMPYNILDHRWDLSIKKLTEIKKNRQVNIHIRSVYLQGLLLSSSPEHFAKANVACSLEITNWLNNTTEKLNRESIADLCVAYARSLPWADALVIGMDSVEQLRNNIGLFSNDKIDQDGIREITSTRPIVGSSTLDPSKWKLL